MGKHAQTSITTPAVQYGAEGSILRNIPPLTPNAENILKEAVWWVDAAHSSANLQQVENLGWGGPALVTTLGSTTSADSNDPKYLDFDGTPYVYLPGVAGNYLLVTDEATLDITGDIDIRAWVALDDWTPSGAQVIVAKREASTQISYQLSVNTTGTLRLSFSTNGTTAETADSTSATGISDGTAYWVRVTRDQAAGEVEFFVSSDGILWSQLGATVTGVSTSAFHSGSAPLRFGVIGTGTNPTSGKFYRAQVLNGIDGTPVLDVDTSVIKSGSDTSFTARTGQTVTINRSTSGRKSVAVTHPLWLFGTDDYMEVNNRWLDHSGTNYVYLPGVNGNFMSVPDEAALDITGDIDLRVKVAADDWTPSAVKDLIAKWESGATSYVFRLLTDGGLRFIWSSNNSEQQPVADSTSPVSILDGEPKWVRSTINTNNGSASHEIKFWTSDDGSSWDQLGDTIVRSGSTAIFASTAPLLIGAIFSTSGLNAIPGKIYNAQVLNGISGSVVLDVDTSVITSPDVTSFTASTGQTVTVNRTGSTYRSAGVVRPTYILPGASNTFIPSTYSLLDFDEDDSFTLVCIVKSYPNVSSERLISKRRNSPTFEGYQIAISSISSVETYITTLTSGVTAVSPYNADGQVQSLLSVIDRSKQTIVSYTNNIPGTTLTASSVGSLFSTMPLRLGRVSAGNNDFADVEIVAAAIFRRVLTESEIEEISRYYQERVK